MPKIHANQNKTHARLMHHAHSLRVPNRHYALNRNSLFHHNHRLPAIDEVPERVAAIPPSDIIAFIPNFAVAAHIAQTQPTSDIFAFIPSS